MISSRTPSAASSRASAMTSSIGLVACLPRILGIAQNVQSRSQPSEIFRNAKCLGVIRSRARVGQRLCRRRLKDDPLLVQPADQPVGDLGDFLAAEDADQVVDLGHVRRAALPSAARPGSPRRSRPAVRPAALSSSISSIAPNDSCRACSMKPQVLTIDEIGPFRLVDQLVAVELQQPEHPLAVDQILGTAQADEAVLPLHERRIAGRRQRRGRGGIRQDRELSRHQRFPADHSVPRPIRAWGGDNP